MLSATQSMSWPFSGLLFRKNRKFSYLKMTALWYFFSKNDWGSSLVNDFGSFRANFGHYCVKML